MCTVTLEGPGSWLLINGIILFIYLFLPVATLARETCLTSFAIPILPFISGFQPHYKVNSSQWNNTGRGGPGLETEPISHQKTCDSKYKCWLIIITNKRNLGRKCDLPFVRCAWSTLEYASWEKDTTLSIVENSRVSLLNLWFSFVWFLDDCTTLWKVFAVSKSLSEDQKCKLVKEK